MKILVAVLVLFLSACSGVSDKLAALAPSPAKPAAPAAPAFKGEAWTPITESVTRTFYYEPYGLSAEAPGLFSVRIASVQKEAQPGTTVRKPDIVTWKINCINSMINSSELNQWIPTVKGSISEFIKNEVCGSVYPVNRLTYHYVGLADRMRYYIQGNEVLVHGGADDARALRVLSSSTNDNGKQQVLLLRYEVNCKPRTNLVYNVTDDRVMLPWKTVEPGANSIDAFLFDRACNGANTYMARVKAFTDADSLAGSRVQFRAPIKEAPAKPETPAKGEGSSRTESAGKPEVPMSGQSDLKSPLQSGSGAGWKPTPYGSSPSLQVGAPRPASAAPGVTAPGMTTPGINAPSAPAQVPAPAPAPAPNRTSQEPNSPGVPMPKFLF